ncbi:MAG: hypothetical protein AB1656_00635 [Candidatus Omnitrophota bacterium]
MKPSTHSRLTEMPMQTQNPEELELTAEDLQDIEDARISEAEANKRGFIEWSKIKDSLGLND